MVPSTVRPAVAVLLAVGLVSACRSAAPDAGPRVIQPGAPGEAAREIDPGEAVATLPHTPADVQFMRGMIAHHLQALEMTALVPERTTRSDILLLAQRIAASQDDEIALMKKWLRDRGEAVPDAHAHHAGDHARMPGMLTAAQMERLTVSSGEEFDRLFLAAMVIHHEGALSMVAELFATPGAAQETDVFMFASHVEADQRMEITRMHRMLRAGPARE